MIGYATLNQLMIIVGFNMGKNAILVNTMIIAMMDTSFTLIVQLNKKFTNAKKATL